jgi:L-histidine N-alpha-methyltransferase
VSASPKNRLHILTVPENPVPVLQSLREGLLRSPREISPRYFYDDVGSRLFEEITRLPEYYLTRAEDWILRNVGPEIVERTGAEALIELGSGSSIKTRILLDAMHRAGTLRRYVPFDVSESAVREAAGGLLAAYPELEIRGVVGDFTEHLDAVPESGLRELCIFLGGTIGNFRPEEAVRFLRRLARRLETGDHFLLGTDLVKDPVVLHAAYNDARGVTARFNRNILAVVNRLFDADFDVDAFRHRAVYNPERRWIEMWLVAEKTHKVRVRRIDLEITVEAGEEILTEVSAKYDRGAVESLLGAAGFGTAAFYTDPDRRFALTLARRL